MAMETKEQIVFQLERQLDELKAKYGTDAFYMKEFIRIERSVRFLKNDKALQERLKNAHIKCDVWNFNGDVAYFDEIENAIDNGKNVFMWGCPGCGKTFAVSAFLRSKIYKMQNCKLLHAYHLEREVIKSSSYTYEKRDPMEEATETKYVVLDDLGLEKPTEYVIKLLFQVLNDREENGLNTIMVSNYDQQELKLRLMSYTENEKAVEALTSRIFNRNCEIIHFEGEDRR